MSRLLCKASWFESEKAADWFNKMFIFFSKSDTFLFFKLLQRLLLIIIFIVYLPA